MNYGYNIREKEKKNTNQDTFFKLKEIILSCIKGIKKWILSLKCITIKKLQDKNQKLSWNFNNCESTALETN